ncbi:hypothetical protein EBB07_19670 [Paenibacillaceae bacterium]|nr:hypothetical protein EBB07_19670 [Paenibacillaceae bacterium]
MNWRDCYEYHVWSYLHLIDHLENLPQVVFVEVTGGSFSTISETMDHIYLTDLMWLTILRGDNPSAEVCLPKGVKDLPLIQRQFAALHHEMRRMLFESDKPNLKREVRFKNDRGGENEASCEEVIMTMVQHGAYHRGAVAAMLRQLGFQSASSEFMTYLKAKPRKYYPDA